ncbi:MAG: HEAT repeat domain-containing protein [Candidatus Brocadiaceae bacterium]|nr:HEAT repeat domain-containing protein [Candidatus Brocadiaceae bacterium]
MAQEKLDEWIEQVRSNDPTIRSAAAVSLLGLNFREAQESLIKMLGDRNEREDVRISIIKAFGFMRDDRAIYDLINLLDTESEPIRTAATDSLGRLRTNDALQIMIKSMRNHKQTSAVKISLAKALGNTNDRNAVEALIKMLADNDQELREAAKNSLEKITKQATNNNDSSWWKEWWKRNKAKSREQWLEEIVLKQEENSKQLESKIEQLKLEVAQKSIRLIETRAEKMDQKQLADALKSDYPEVRIFAVKELAKIKDPSIPEMLMSAISDTQEEVRIEVVQALGTLGSEKAVQILISALSDESLAVREKAAKALGQREKQDAVDALLSALHVNSNVSVVYAIIEALGQIGNPKSVDHVITFLSHEKPNIRECTAAALGNFRDSRAVEPLITALSDDQERVRWYAADSLGKIGNPTCVDSLITLLADTSARVRESAVTALGQIGNQQAIESLLKTLKDNDSRVAERAAESLINIKEMSFDTMDIIATAFYTNEDYKRAKHLFEKQLERYSNQPQLQEKVLQSKIKLAKIFMTLKDWQEALYLYEEIVERVPGDDAIKRELIRCLKEMQQFDQALEWYSVWITDNPQNKQFCWQGRLDIARTMYEQERFDKVKEVIESLKMDDPALGGEEIRAQFESFGK